MEANWRSRLGALSAAFATIASLLAIAACGSATTPNNTGTSSSTGSDSQSRALEFARCMRSHGVSSFPDPIPGTVSFPPVARLNQQSPAFRFAQQACKQFLPSSVPHTPQVSPAKLSLIRAGALTMAKCMRARAVPNFPDASISLALERRALNITFRPFPKIDTAGPAFQAAQNACSTSIGGADALAVFVRQEQGLSAPVGTGAGSS
jgi:hypothetical protein